MSQFEYIVSIIGTAGPLFVATATCFVKWIKSIRNGRQERKKRLWSDFAQQAVKLAEALGVNGGLAGMTKKEAAMNDVKAACVKYKIPFERDKVSEIIENIIDLTKKVNYRHISEVNFDVPQAEAVTAQTTEMPPSVPTDIISPDKKTMKIILGRKRGNEQ